MKKVEEQKNYKGTEQFLAIEIIRQTKTVAKRWKIIFAITLAALIITNACWIYVFCK